MNPPPPVSLWIDPRGLGPVTDLYQLTMMAGYRAAGMDQQPAVFELFVRRLPPNRSFLLFAGLEQLVGDLLHLSFTPQQIDGLKRLPAFQSTSPSFFEWLADLSFTGDLWAIPEGTVVFPGETLLRVEAPLAIAQWVETFILASLCYPTLAASKAARIVLAAQGRPTVEFGLRRGHGPQAGMLAARSAFIAGFSGTSNVEAALRLGIPCFGTMAHAWVQAFPNEQQAFSAYAQSFPENTTLLIDTYDTLQAAHLAASIQPPIKSVRLDSGDLLFLSREVRSILDRSGRSDVSILASGDLDENSIDALLAAGAPIDSFGVGTELITSRDAPALSMVYKLVESAGKGRVKLSPGKKTYPLAKQVWRQYDSTGRFQHDHVTAANESATGSPLLVQVLQDGRLVHPLPALSDIRHLARAQLQALPDALRDLRHTAPYPITYSARLESEASRLGLSPSPTSTP